MYEGGIWVFFFWYFLKKFGNLCDVLGIVVYIDVFFILVEFMGIMLEVILDGWSFLFVFIVKVVVVVGGCILFF